MLVIAPGHIVDGDIAHITRCSPSAKAENHRRGFGLQMKPAGRLLVRCWRCHCLSGNRQQAIPLHQKARRQGITHGNTGGQGQADTHAMGFEATHTRLSFFRLRLSPRPGAGLKHLAQSARYCFNLNRKITTRVGKVYCPDAQTAHCPTSQEREQAQQVHHNLLTLRSRATFYTQLHRGRSVRVSRCGVGCCWQQ
ncbi:hypothetical protein PHLH7_55720 [Pseudomonas sp. Ost2]|nr:hypothetical protein PHLH7_55720 [Pseudomonas sp. Ost2]